MAFGMTQWEPVREIAHLQDEINQWFRWANEGIWSPLMEVEETDDEVTVRLDLPGMKKEEIKLLVQDDALVISGERKREADNKDKKVHVVETVYGKFQRVLGLPAGVDGSQAQATYESGILTVRLPKKEQAKPKEIPIEVR